MAVAKIGSIALARTDATMLAARLTITIDQASHLFSSTARFSGASTPGIQLQRCGKARYSSRQPVRQSHRPFKPSRPHSISPGVWL
jgi:hypothetical protein